LETFVFEFRFVNSICSETAVNYVEIRSVYVGKMIIKAAKRIVNSDKICHSYSDLNFGVTFFETQCRLFIFMYVVKIKLLIRTIKLMH